MPGLWDAIASIFSGGNDTGGTAYPTSPTSSPGVAGGWFDWGNLGRGSSGGVMTSESGIGAGIDPYSSGVGAGVSPDAGVTSPMGGSAGGFNPAQIIGGLGRNAGGIMSLVNQFRSSPTEKLLEKGQKQAAGISGDLAASGRTQLQQSTAGQLSPAQQAQVDQFKKQRLAQYRQYLASAGIPESSAMADMEGKANMEAQEFTAKLLQQNYQNSMNALGLADNSLARQAAYNLAYEKEVAKSQAEAMKAIGELAGMLEGLG